jgi:cell wall-associated NlpC family hydrolase
MVITTRLSEIERTHGFVHASTPGGNEIWVSEGSVCNTMPHPVNPSGEDIVSTAQRFMGTPYLWGGSTPFGIDCSGLTQLVYRLHGMELRRDAWMQAEDTRFRPVEREELTAGDLVFFARESGTRRISHVGIAMGNGEFIHARGSGEGVRINKISDEPYVTIFKTAARVVRKR